MMLGVLMRELEDFSVRQKVRTPSGRFAFVKKLLSGASKRDAFDRIVCQYEGGGAKDLVTLQPHQLEPVNEPAPAPQPSGQLQFTLNF
jgi:hypothetical protein